MTFEPSRASSSPNRRTFKEGGAAARDPSARARDVVSHLPVPVVWRIALREIDLPQMAKLVGFVIDTYIGANPSWSVSVARIAAGGGIKSPRTVEQAVNLLVQSTLLQVDYGGGRSKTNEYSRRLTDETLHLVWAFFGRARQTPQLMYETPQLTLETPHLKAVNPAPGAHEVEVEVTAAEEKKKDTAVAQGELREEHGKRQRLARHAAVSPRDEETSLSSAAASVGEPPSLLDVVHALKQFRTRDINSVRVVEPLALQLPKSVFDDVVARTLRRDAANDVGLLVTLMRTACSERRAAAKAHSRAAAAAPVEALASSRRRDPEAYVRRLVALPKQATLDQVRSFVGQYVDDRPEFDRLVALAAELLAESPRKKVERWIREVSLEVVDLAAVHALIDEWVDEWGDVNYAERGSLHELAEEARELRSVDASAGGDVAACGLPRRDDAATEGAA